MTDMYVLTAVSSFLILIAYIGFFGKKDIWFLMTFISLLVCNSGYLTLSVSKCLEEALLANRISYLGNVFLPFFLLMTIIKVCKFRYPKALPFILSFINALILAITITPGYLPLYYSHVYFRIDNGTALLVKEYGPLHNVYYIFLLAYFSAMIGVIVRSFFNRKIVSYKHALFLAAAVFVNIAIYITEKTIGLKFELLSVSYLITAVFLLMLYREIEDYDINGIMENTLETDSTGVVLFDENNNFKGCNEDAAEIFPELYELKLEYEVPRGALSLQETIVASLEGGKAQENMTFQKNDRIYRLESKPFHRKSNASNKFLGTAVVIDDDTTQQQYLKLISSYNEKLEAEVAQKTRHVIAMHDNLIRGMADMVEGRDPNTGGHIKRTSSVVAIFVGKLRKSGFEGLSESFLKNVAKAAPMHDLGKIAIDDAILRKPGKYTPEEYAIMQTHSEKGAEIVGKILKRDDDPEFYDIAVNVAHYHHERYDGAGYPDHIMGESIPIEARIMALADVFDALVSKRCYKEKYSYDEAFGIINDSLGKQFDSALGRVFLDCREELEDCYNFI